MKIKNYILPALMLTSISLFAVKKPLKPEVLSIIEKVNNYWQSTHPVPGNPFWDEAAYHTGNMEAYSVTGNEAYRQYSETWAEKINGKVLSRTTKRSGNTNMEKQTIMCCLAIGKSVFRPISTSTIYNPTITK